jgi:hypothetical protein
MIGKMARKLLVGSRSLIPTSVQLLVQETTVVKFQRTDVVQRILLRFKDPRSVFLHRGLVFEHVKVHSKGRFRES